MSSRRHSRIAIDMAIHGRHDSCVFYKGKTQQRDNTYKYYNYEYTHVLYMITDATGSTTNCLVLHHSEQLHMSPSVNLALSAIHIKPAGYQIVPDNQFSCVIVTAHRSFTNLPRKHVYFF